MSTSSFEALSEAQRNQILEHIPGTEPFKREQAQELDSYISWLIANPSIMMQLFPGLFPQLEAAEQSSKATSTAPADLSLQIEAQRAFSSDDVSAAVSQVQINSFTFLVGAYQSDAGAKLADAGFEPKAVTEFQPVAGPAGPQNHQLDSPYAPITAIVTPETTASGEPAPVAVNAQQIMEQDDFHVHFGRQVDVLANHEQFRAAEPEDQNCITMGVMEIILAALATRQANVLNQWSCNDLLPGALELARHSRLAAPEPYQQEVQRAHRESGPLLTMVMDNPARLRTTTNAAEIFTSNLASHIRARLEMAPQAPSIAPFSRP